MHESLPPLEAGSQNMTDYTVCLAATAASEVSSVDKINIDATVRRNCPEESDQREDILKAPARSPPATRCAPHCVAVLASSPERFAFWLAHESSALVNVSAGERAAPFSPTQQRLTGQPMREGLEGRLAGGKRPTYAPQAEGRGAQRDPRLQRGGVIKVVPVSPAYLNISWSDIPVRS
ncbi:hypothetical protein ATH50_3525 [Haloplanus aerogenes]|uniref:Uncharacterized protein n=1 Tax=Haloplanus aerogenes TaxID=660522 RepID=A0A3M0CG22_9EURY|nr:hypothetical protein ATH50_3525 [Haloplanus aerogenes]